MKITYHKDGTYSITGMNRLDISNLAFATMLAEHFHSSDERKRKRQADDDGTWDTLRTREFQRLNRVLTDVERGSIMADETTKYLPAGASVTLVSSYLHGDYGQYDVVKDGRVYGQRHN